MNKTYILLRFIYMYKELLFHFILGGLLFSSIYYIANVVEDPALSAVIALFPISLFSGFIIKKVDTCQKYFENSIYVLLIGLLLVIILSHLLKMKKYPKNILIGIVIIFWFILQICRYKYIKK